MGRLLAVCTRETMRGEVVREVMSQAVAVLWIHVPILEKTLASQRLLKVACRRGLQGADPAF